MIRTFSFKVVSPIEDTQGNPGTDLWAVRLPHQCDTWDITPHDEPFSGVPHAQAVAELEQFIAEAQRTLERLRQRRVSLS